MTSFSYVRCPKCQAVSRADSKFCFQCGAPLVGASPAPAPPLSPTPAFRGAPAPGSLGPVELPFGTPPPPVSYEFRKSVDRTRTGVILLAVGAFLGWIPLIGIIGSLLSLAGALLVILGRTAFGTKHARNVVIAIALFIVGLVGGFVLAGGSLASIAGASLSSPAQAQTAITGVFNTLLLGAIILGLISGMAGVFFLWELLDIPGRILILASYAVGIVIGVAVYVIIMGQLGPALSAAFSGSPPDLGPLFALDAQINNLRLLSAFPAFLAAGAAYVAWSRIESGQIPKKGTGSPRAPLA